IEGTEKAIAIATDCNSRYIYLDPQTGGKIAVAETARNIVCTGAKPLAITDGLNFGDPTNPEVFWQMEQSIDGISEACNILKTPVVSGNVSLYNQSKGNDILPTPIIGMVGLLDSVEAAIPNHFQSPAALIYLIGEVESEVVASERHRMIECTYSGKAPTVDLQLESKRQEELLGDIQAGIIKSAPALSEGGLGVAPAEGLFPVNEYGAQLSLQG